MQSSVDVPNPSPASELLQTQKLKQRTIFIFLKDFGNGSNNKKRPLYLETDALRPVADANKLDVYENPAKVESARKRKRMNKLNTKDSVVKDAEGDKCVVM